MRVVFVPFQSVAPESSWLGGTFLKYYKKICKIKNEGNENKMMLGVLNCTMDKLTGLVKIKHKDFVVAVPIMLCLNSSWVMDLQIYGEGRTQIPPSPSATIDPLPKISIDRLY